MSNAKEKQESVEKFNREYLESKKPKPVHIRKKKPNKNTIQALTMMAAFASRGGYVWIKNT